MPTFELDHGVGRFRSWLKRVAIGTLADRARRLDRDRRAEEKWTEQMLQAGADDDHGLDEEWNAAHQKRVLEYVLPQVRAETDPRQWACFQKHLIERRASQDVAQELGMIASTVRQYSSRVRARVRAKCLEYMEELGDV